MSKFGPQPHYSVATADWSNYKKNPRPKMDQSDSLSQEYAIYKRNTAIGGETASLQCPGEKVLEVLAEISGYGSLKWDC